MAGIGRRTDTTGSLSHRVLAPLLMFFAAVAACRSSSNDTPTPPTSACQAGQIQTPDGCLAAYGSPSKIDETPTDDPSGPQIKLFGPRQFSGDAPFATELGFVVTSPSGAALTC